jgi:hypothetical protein
MLGDCSVKVRKPYCGFTDTALSDRTAICFSSVRIRFTNSAWVGFPIKPPGSVIIKKAHTCLLSKWLRFSRCVQNAPIVIMVRISNDFLYFIPHLPPNCQFLLNFYKSLNLGLKFFYL